MGLTFCRLNFSVAVRTNGVASFDGRIPGVRERYQHGTLHLVPEHSASGVEGLHSALSS